MSGAPALEHLRLALQSHLALIYQDHDPVALAERLIEAMGFDEHVAEPVQLRNKWSQADTLVITYGDSIKRNGEKPLDTLETFCRERLKPSVSWIHILPFNPFTSDDGFAVSDYDTVNPALGDWSDIEAIGEDFRIMADMVINHCSASHRWFLSFLRGEEPYTGYFVEASPYDDLSQVVRPRTSPLLQPFDAAGGTTKNVWCTFGPDQVDLNYANPDVLIEVAKLLKHYIGHGVNIFRLDAIAFLWKELGTPCINLPQTHELIRLMRTLAEHLDPETVIITETNLPNRENLSYFGNGNEAHIVYNFSLPPLLLHTMLTGDSDYLHQWMMRMPPARSGTTYLNFIASHDGIGLRPAEGLLSDEEIDNLAEAMRGFGGLVSSRTVIQQQSRPYEINISLYDAMKGTLDGEDEFQFERFICAHAIMLALEGVPAIYLHSLVATGNDREKVERTGSNRAINRHNWDADELEALLDDPSTHNHRVFEALGKLIRLRNRQPAFHPNATQFTLHLGKEVFAFWRQSIERHQSIFAINNVTNRRQVVPLAAINLIVTDNWYDLISGQVFDDLYAELVLEPYQTLWISNLPPSAS